MIRGTRRMWLSVLAVMAVALAGCGDSAGGPVGDTARSLASLPADALFAEAAAATSEVESLRGELTMEITFFGTTVRLDGEIRVRGDDSHMVFVASSDDGDEETIEMLFRSGRAYAHVQDEGWFEVDAEALEVDAESFEAMLDNRGLLDMEGVADLAGRLSEVDGENIGGVAHRKFTGALTADDIVDLNAGAFTDEDIEMWRETNALVDATMWVNTETGIATRTELELRIPGGEGVFGSEVSFEVTDVNGPVEIPDAPDDARPARELGEF